MSWYGLRGAAKGFPICGMVEQSHRLRGLCVLGARAHGALNVEILLEFENSLIVLVSPLLLSCQWYSSLKASVMGHSEEGAWCLVF